MSQAPRRVIGRANDYGDVRSSGRSGTLLTALVASALVAGCTPVGTPPGPEATNSSLATPRSTAIATRTPRDTATQAPRAAATPMPLPDYVKAVVEVGDDPGYATVAYGSLWVANHHGDSISRVDADTVDVVATIEVPGEPTGVASGFDSIWTVTQVQPAIRRIDPETNTLVATISVDGRAGPINPLVEAGGAMWFASDLGTLDRIDAATNAVTASLDVHPGCRGSIAAGFDSIWYAALCNAEELLRIDPTDMAVVARIPVARGSRSPVVGNDSVWTISDTGRLSQISPERNSVIAEAEVAPGAEQMAFGLGSAWIRADANSLVRVDPAELQVVETYDDLPSAPIPGGGLAVGGQGVWVVNFGDATVWLIQP